MEDGEAGEFNGNCTVAAYSTTCLMRQSDVSNAVQSESEGILTSSKLLICISYSQELG